MLVPFVTGMSDDTEVTQGLIRLAIGPLFTGWLLQVFITGMCIQPALRHLFRVNRTKISQLDSSHQRHLERESRHPPHVRIILAIVSILNILVTCCTFYQVTWWGSLQIMTADDLWAFTIVDAFLPIPSALVGALVQTFFALRAWKLLKRNYFFLVFIGACILTGLSGAFATAAFSLMMPSDLSENYDKIYVAVEVWLVGSAGTDVIVAGVLIVALLLFRTKFDSRTDSAILRCISLAFETAALTAVFALAGAIIYHITKDYNSANVYYALQYPMPALYTFSYIYCLDTVMESRKRRAEDTDPSANLVGVFSDSRSGKKACQPNACKCGKVECLEKVAEFDKLPDFPQLRDGGNATSLYHQTITQTSGDHRQRRHIIDTVKLPQNTNNAGLDVMPTLHTIEVLPTADEQSPQDSTKD